MSKLRELGVIKRVRYTQLVSSKNYTMTKLRELHLINIFSDTQLVSSKDYTMTLNLLIELLENDSIKRHISKFQ